MRLFSPFDEGSRGLEILLSTDDIYYFDCYYWILQRNVQ